MKLHSDTAWEVARQFSYTLASDTRTLAALIDDLVDKKIKEAAQIAYAQLAETRHVTLARQVSDSILSMQHGQREAPQSYAPHVIPAKAGTPIKEQEA